MVKTELFLRRWIGSSGSVSLRTPVRPVGLTFNKWAEGPWEPTTAQEDLSWVTRAHSKGETTLAPTEKKRPRPVQDEEPAFSL